MPVLISSGRPDDGSPEQEPENPFAAPDPDAVLRPPSNRRPRERPTLQRPPTTGRRGGQLPLMLALLGWLLTTLLLPWSLAAVACCLAAVVLGWRTRRRLHRSAPATGAIVIGLVGALVAVAVSVFATVYRAELASYQECVRGANTEAARQECQQQLDDLRDRLTRTG